LLAVLDGELAGLDVVLLVLQAALEGLVGEGALEKPSTEAEDGDGGEE
jgi:hypothetical protein